MNGITGTGSTSLAACWKEHVEAWKCSGVSQNKFCQEHALSYHRFMYWRRKFERGSGSSQTKRESGGFATVDYRPEVNERGKAPILNSISPACSSR